MELTAQTFFQLMWHNGVLAYSLHTWVADFIRPFTFFCWYASYKQGTVFTVLPIVLAGTLLHALGNYSQDFLYAGRIPQYPFWQYLAVLFPRCALMVTIGSVMKWCNGRPEPTLMTPVIK